MHRHTHAYIYMLYTHAYTHTHIHTQVYTYASETSGGVGIKWRRQLTCRYLLVRNAATMRYVRAGRGCSGGGRRWRLVYVDLHHRRQPFDCRVALPPVANFIRSLCDGIREKHRCVRENIYTIIYGCGVRVTCHLGPPHTYVQIKAKNTVYNNVWKTQNTPRRLLSEVKNNNNKKNYNDKNIIILCVCAPRVHYYYCDIVTAAVVVARGKLKADSRRVV